MADKVRSISDAAKAAGVPPYIKMEELANLGPVVYNSAFGASRTAPDGNATNGFVVNVTADSGQHYECFIGAEILVRLLSQVEFPFRAGLAKEGRAWTFTD